MCKLGQYIHAAPDSSTANGPRPLRFLSIKAAIIMAVPKPLMSGVAYCYRFGTLGNAFASLGYDRKRRKLVGKA